MLVANRQLGFILAIRVNLVKLKCFFLLLWTATAIGRGTDWYVSTNGTGDGSFNHPWALQTAMTNPAVQPGDTIWLHQGVYIPDGSFVDPYHFAPVWWCLTMSGASNNLITFRSCSNEWAMIDRPWEQGNYLRFRDLEFYDSAKGTYTNNQPNQPICCLFYGGHMETDELINCLIHDIHNMGGGETARGCLIWNVGQNSLEHVFYPASVMASGNIFLWEANVIFNTSTASTPSSCWPWNCISNIVVSPTTGPALTPSGDSWQDAVVGNYFYDVLSVISGSAGSGTVFSNNVMSFNDTGCGMGNYGATTSSYTNLSFTHNVLYMSAVRQGNNGMPLFNLMDNTATNMVVDCNHYYSNPTNADTEGFVYLRTNNQALAFGLWQTNCGFDVHGSFTPNIKPPDSWRVFPNQDQPKRANIGIFNWSVSNNVAVSLAGVLNAGDSYQLINAENYKGGAIQTGIYNGTNIWVPMTNLAVAPVLYGYGSTNTRDGGFYLPTNALTTPEFGAFVVIGSAALAPPQDFRISSIGN